MKLLAEKATLSEKTAGRGSLKPRPIPPGGGIINGGHRMIFDAAPPLFAYHKNDADGNMQIFAARPADGKWNIQPLTDWSRPVPFSGRGSMGFIEIRLGALEEILPGVLAIGYRHKDYGSGKLVFAGYL